MEEPEIDLDKDSANKKVPSKPRGRQSVQVSSLDHSESPSITTLNRKAHQDEPESSISRLNSEAYIKTADRFTFPTTMDGDKTRDRANTQMKHAHNKTSDKDDDMKRSVSSTDQLMAHLSLRRHDSYGKMSTTSSKRAKGQKHRDFKITTKHQVIYDAEKGVAF